MPLPDDPKTPWPPVDLRPFYDRFAEHAAWYSGDPDRLRRYYGKASDSTVQRRGWLSRFWRRTGVEALTGVAQRPRGVHLPMAGDLAQTSADLLFSEAPTVTIPESQEGSAGSATQDRLSQIIEETGIHNTLLEAAEVAAALGGVYLRPMWDAEVSEFPLLTVEHHDTAVPEFRFGILVAVTFWRRLGRTEDGLKVRRHLERHESGVILHGLYEGDDEVLGSKIPLNDDPTTAALVESLDDGDQITLDGFEGILPRYIPNVLPNREHRRSHLGRSDLAGIETLLDALDETWTSWMRDIRLGKARVLVAEEFLDKQAPGGAAWFDTEQEIFSPLNMAPTEREKGIEQVQFEIRTEAHMNTALSLIEQIANQAGYSPQTFVPRNEGAAESGTALKMRERKSYRTKAKKERYFRSPVEATLENLLWIDRVMLQNSGTEILRPRLAFSDAVSPDIGELAQTASLLRSAEAASIEVRVRMVHPEWGKEEVEAEVKRIQAERDVQVPNIPDLP